MQHHRAFGRPLDTLTVAVIDNRRPMLSLMRAMLAAIGTGRIESFESPTEALDAMTANPPDLIIAAAAMQPISGAALVKALRRAESGPLALVPAMLTSARAKPAQVEEALRAGAHQVLVLPTSASTLYRRLDFLINDDRPFELKGDRYVLRGLEERLALSFQRPVYAPAGGIPPVPRVSGLKSNDPAGRRPKKARVVPH
jgi:two-component system chemotaxis response regulator CheY